jgi:ABC-type dipeptide/oligopeptide/nickel transport system permease subunit
MRRFLAQKGGVAGAAIVLAVVFVAMASPWLAPHSIDRTDLLNTWGPPDAANLLGTDELGRDILSRLIVGARVSLTVALSVMAITLVIGVGVGMVAGYLGGWIDAVAMRLVDIVLAFPEVVLAILVAAVIGPGIATVIVALSLVWWPGIARLTRSLVLVQRRALYIDAAICTGLRTPAILWRHVLPNILPSLLVRASVGVGFIIMAEATLSFLGLGVQEPVPSWGSMVRDGLPMLGTDPMLAIAGSVIIGLTIIGFNLLGDGLRDALDPTMKGR